MSASKANPLLIMIALGFSGLRGGAFGAEVRSSAPQFELAQSAPVTRGERIQPLTPKLPPMNAPVVSVTMNATVTTNQTVSFKDGDYFGFEKLAGFAIPLAAHLEYATNATLADAEVNAMIPATIRAMAGRTILVNGYMTPLHYEGGKTRLFLLSRNPSACCFGDLPLIHEMIEVRMKGAAVPVHDYVPVQVRGVLHVGAKRNGAALACIYRLAAESVAEAEN